MENSSSSDELIETLIALHYGENGTIREKYVLRESLRNLVRMARSETVDSLLRNRYIEQAACDENMFH